MTSVSPSSTRSTWHKKISSVSRNSTSSPQCSLIMQSMMVAGLKAASVMSERAIATRGAAFSIMASRSHSAPIGLSLRSTRSWEFTPQSRAPRSTGKIPAAGFQRKKSRYPEAIEAYTMGAAFAEFQEREKGSITPGKLADMVIVSDNIFELKPEAIRNVKVKTTIVGGKVVYGER